ncbi:C-GCAxxG-C-C family (seleno)protein [Acidobacteriota bacterium]
MKRITRKQFFFDAFKYTSGAAAGITGLNFLAGQEATAEPKIPTWPWPYTKLDPEAARMLAHDSFYEMGCCYAGFAGIIGLLQKEVGEPFSGIPLEMMSYGGGGLKGWGTICGALNGAAAAISLVRVGKASTPVINELMGWYTEALLPSDQSNTYGAGGKFPVDKGIKALPQNKSGSPLCHVSVTGWCSSAGYEIGSPEQEERCSRVAGDTAAKAVLLLNAQQDGNLRTEYVMPASTSECLSCHGPEKEVANVDHKMTCTQCHGKPHEDE